MPSAGLPRPHCHVHTAAGDGVDGGVCYCIEGTIRVGSERSKETQRGLAVGGGRCGGGEGGWQPALNMGGMQLWGLWGLWGVTVVSWLAAFITGRSRARCTRTLSVPGILGYVGVGAPAVSA